MTTLIVYLLFSYITIGIVMMIEDGIWYARLFAWIVAPVTLPIRLGYIISKYSQ